MTINCCICRDSTTLYERVIHHCHLTGKVFGVAHSSCNLKARSTSYLPIFFHNLSRYDAHHFIKNLTLLSGEKLSAISRTDETYISFSVSVPVGSYYTRNHKNATITNNLRFLDSFQFMSQSLDSLAKTLKTDDFSLLKTFFLRHIRQSIGSYSLEKAIFHTPFRTHSQSSRNLYPIMKTTGKTP